MSFYAYNEGTITFKIKKEFEKTFEDLVNNGWYSKEKDCFLGECDEPLKEFGGKIHPETLQITLPTCMMRNPHRMLRFLDEVKWEGRIVGHSTDGCCEAWVQTPEGSKSYDLEDYARRRNLFIPNPEDDDYYEHFDHIIEVWEKDPDWEANSVNFIKDEQHDSET